MPKITDYDREGYNYYDYWKKFNREYSDISERIAIKKILRNLPREIFEGRAIDLGGSFGRLDPIYRKFFKDRTIVDNSQNSLNLAKELHKENCPNLVCSNIYSLPFENEIFSFASSVRVIHHIEDLENLFHEVYRVLKKGGFFMVEVANKNHFKAVLKNFFKGNFGFLKEEKFIQPISKEGLFLNYSSKFVLENLKKVGFEDVKKVLSVSNFRSSLSQKKFLLKFFLGIEDMVQKSFVKIDFGPSIFYLARK